MGFKVSIITAVYNNCDTISQAIESVLYQDYPDIEYIIIDGNSTDGTVEIIRRYEGKITNWISEPDKGIYYAMNKGLKLATGDIVGILNSDDFYRDATIISKVVKVFIQHQPDALYGDLLYVEAANTQHIVRYWQAKSYHKNKFLMGWMPPHPTFFVKRQIYNQFGVFDTRLRSSADYELMLRLIHKHKIRLAYLPEILVKMRTGGISNKSLKNRLFANQEDYQAWKINDLRPAFYTVWLKPIRKLLQYMTKPKSELISIRSCVEENALVDKP